MSYLNEIPLEEAECEDSPLAESSDIYPLSERESWRYDIASRALQGFIAHGGMSKFLLAKFTTKDVAVTAVEIADALLEELEAKKEGR